MATTTKWSLEKPSRGTLLWDVPVNANADKLDTILYNLRVSYAGTTAPTTNADTGSLWFDTLNLILKVKNAGSWLELLTKTRADALYAPISHTHAVTQLYWAYGTAPIHMAKIYFYNSTNLQVEFGTNPSTDNVCFKWTGTDGTYDVLRLYSSKIVSYKPLEVPAASADSHALNRATGDGRYLQKSTYTANDVLNKVKSIDGVGSGLDADLFQGKTLNQTIELSTATNIVNGTLITTDISASTTSNERFLLKIEGNTGTTGHPIFILGHGYVSTTISNCKAVVLGPMPTSISAFCYDSKLCFYLPKTGVNNYHFYTITVYSGLDGKAINRVISITDVAYPSSGVTKLSTFTLVKTWTSDSNDPNAGAALDADTLGGYDSSVFLKITDLLTQLKLIDGTGSGIDADTLNGKHYSDIRMPPGTIIMYGGTTPPTGTLACEGGNVSRVTYSNLFAVIGTNYGKGDGSTTFGLPDFRGVFARGWDNGAGKDPGREFGTYQADDCKTISQFQTSTANDGIGTGVVTLPADGSWSSYIDTGRSTDGYDVHLRMRLGTNETRPKNLSVMYCIFY